MRYGLAGVFVTPLLEEIQTKSWLVNRMIDLLVV